ncbi:MAG: hypothetical protein U9N80_11945 [Chloroflexota bacterium]|nr:hypothetical protein [Chloroflexota bacterium]
MSPKKKQVKSKEDKPKRKSTAKSSSAKEKEIKTLQAENETLKEELSKAKEEKHTGIRIAVALLIILGCIALTLANFSNWARDTLIDTDAWVAAIGPMSQNPVIVEAFSDAIVEGVSEELGITPLEGPSLLVLLGILDQPLVETVQKLISEAISTVILSDEFNEIWVRAIEIIHGSLVSVLSGDNPFIYAEDGIVYLDFSELLDEILNMLGLKNISLFEPGADGMQFALVESDSLAEMQRILRMIDRIAFLSFIITILCFGGAVALSRWRRSTINAMGIGIAVVMLISLFLFSMGESYILASIVDQAFNDLASEVLHSITTGLIAQTVLLLILGVGVALIAHFYDHPALKTGE